MRREPNEIPEPIMAGRSSILECLISFHQDWRVNWDYPKGSHLLMILHPVCPDAGKTWITDIHQGEVTRKSSPHDGSSQDFFEGLGGF